MSCSEGGGGILVLLLCGGSYGLHGGLCGGSLDLGWFLFGRGCLLSGVSDGLSRCGLSVIFRRGRCLVGGGRGILVFLLYGG